MSATGWNDAEIRRFEFRVGLFKRRGLDEKRAELLADSLVGRDRDRDDRRLCLECAGLQKPLPARNGWPASPPACGPASRAKVGPRRVEPVLDVLQRCLHFTWVKP